MSPFSYVSVTKNGEAIDAVGGTRGAAFLAGGTNLVDEMKLGVRSPGHLVDISRLPLARIEELPGGGLRIGAMVRNAELAWDERVRQRYPVLSQAILAGATAQLRNMASTGGNLLQRTRCTYYRSTHYACNKRNPGSGCAALEGHNRSHAILGTSEKCIATHPSDMAVAMAALDAVVHISGPAGERTVKLNDFYVPYGDDPAKENVLNPGELITAVELPSLPFAKPSHYEKVRDRASFEFALASAAVALDVQDKTIRAARIALGGVATKPWRAGEAERALVDKPATEDSFRAAAELALRGAKPQKHNAFKVDLAKRTLVRALMTAAAL
jgi:xanthine dehydrogenase YagS FAD-binding subunit